MCGNCSRAEIIWGNTVSLLYFVSPNVKLHNRYFHKYSNRGLSPLDLKEFHRIWCAYMVFLAYVLVISGKWSNFLRDNQINLLSCEITRIKIRSTMSLINKFQRKTQMNRSLKVDMTSVFPREGYKITDYSEVPNKRKCPDKQGGGIIFENQINR